MPVRWKMGQKHHSLCLLSLKSCFETDEFSSYLGICLQLNFVCWVLPRFRCYLSSLPWSSSFLCASFEHPLIPISHAQMISNSNEIFCFAASEKDLCAYLLPQNNFNNFAHFLLFYKFAKFIYTPHSYEIRLVVLYVICMYAIHSKCSRCCRYYPNFNLLTCRHRSGVYCWMSICINTRIHSIRIANFLNKHSQLLFAQMSFWTN